jgi:hypothetical protein
MRSTSCSWSMPCSSRRTPPSGEHQRRAAAPSTGPHRGLGKLVSAPTCFRGRGARCRRRLLQSERACRHQWRPHARSRPKMPLSPSTEEMDLLLALAARSINGNEINFCTRWRPSLRLTDKPARSESVLCTGRRARFSGDFSIRRSCPTPRPASAAPEGRSPESEHYGDAAIYRSGERPGFFASASVGANPSPTKARRAWPGCRWC